MMTQIFVFEETHEKLLAERKNRGGASLSHIIAELADKFIGEERGKNGEKVAPPKLFEKVSEVVVRSREKKRKPVRVAVSTNEKVDEVGGITRLKRIRAITLLVEKYIK